MIAQGSEDINAAQCDQRYGGGMRWFPWSTGELLAAWDSLVSVGLLAALV